MYIYVCVDERVSFPDLKIERFHQKILDFWLSLENQIKSVDSFVRVATVGWNSQHMDALHFTSVPSTPYFLVADSLHSLTV